VIFVQLRLRLRDLREDADMNQTEMAKLLKCSQQTYSRYESHTTEIPLESLIFLAEYYNTSVDYLLGITIFAWHYKSKRALSEIT
jgi:transcriptional regulator with XRE-family HTH domain